MYFWRAVGWNKKGNYAQVIADAGASPDDIAAIGITDRNTLAGVVRAFAAARGNTRADPDRIRLLVGSRLETRDGYSLLAYPTDLEAYKRLSRLLTAGNRRAAKGKCDLTFDDLSAHAEGILAIVLPPRRPDDAGRPHAPARRAGDDARLAGR